MIQHILASKSSSILPVLQSDLQLPESLAQWLCEFGAVYHNHSRVRDVNIKVIAGDYLRVHLQPRRFPVDNQNWRDCILADESDFVVIHKPFGIPTHPTVDNLYENAAHQISRVLGTAIHVTHRLDVATSGILLLAKTKELQRNFNRLLSLGGVQKTYLAHVSGQLTRTGIVEHFMESSNYLPKRISDSPIEGWQQCLLEILETRPSNSGSQVRIRLITGRTHQIRAQLSALGHPIIGDKLYGGELPWEKIEQIGLQAQTLSFRLPGMEISPHQSSGRDYFFTIKDSKLNRDSTVFELVSRNEMITI